MDKREKIIHAAVEVFKEKGIEKTKIADIVKLAGIAQGTYYLYFPSKLAVMPAIAEVMVEKTIAAVKNEVQEEAPFSIRLSQVVDAIFKINRDYRDVLALIYAGLASSEHIKEWESVYEPFYSWLTEFFHEARASGKIRESIHVERISKLFIGLVESAAEQIYLYDYRQDEQAAVQKAEVLDFLKHGLGIRE